MNNVFVTIFKLNNKYFIEIFKNIQDAYLNIWEGSDLNEGYSYVVKELLTINKENNNIHFLYKTTNNCFIRLMIKKRDIMSKLKEFYNNDLNLIDYKRVEVKDNKKNLHQLLWCIQKEEESKLNSFFNTLNIKKKAFVPVDYYYTLNNKNLSLELIIVIGYSKIYAMYYDEIGLSSCYLHEIKDYKEMLYIKDTKQYEKYLNEIVYLINYMIRLYNNVNIDRVNLIIHNSVVLKDIRYLVYNIDHLNVVIDNEK